jgi:hypothetical protein
MLVLLSPAALSTVIRLDCLWDMIMEDIYRGLYRISCFLYVWCSARGLVPLLFSS